MSESSQISEPYDYSYDEDEDDDELEVEMEEVFDDDDDVDSTMVDTAGDAGTPRHSASAGAPDVEYLSSEQLIQAQLQAIEEVNEIFQIPPGTARILLAKNGWDKEKLLERYFGGDQDALFREAQVVNPHAEGQVVASAKVAGTDDDGSVSCEICLEDVPAKSLHALPCGHFFCTDCWRQYLMERVINQGSAEIECPASDCNILVDEYTVTKILKEAGPGEAKTLSQYHKLAVREYVRVSRNMRWCPAPGCEWAVRCRELSKDTTSSAPASFEDVLHAAVTCKCGAVFCFRCGRLDHRPITCVMVERWERKCADDSETSNWLSSNTKECPQCRSTIEKSGGCNHMTCGQCKHEFCWVCLGPWQPHGSEWYNCNRFDESDAVAARDEQAKSRQALDRYLFYFNRYANHAQSRKLEGKLWEMVHKKQHDMQQAGMSWIEVQFLSKGLETLQGCRTTLQYTYVFAYYLKKTNECEIFEANQRDLQMATENLSRYLEGDASEESFDELRRKVLDLSSYVAQRQKALIGHVQDGHARNAWEFNVDVS